MSPIQISFYTLWWTHIDVYNEGNEIFFEKFRIKIVLKCQNFVKNSSLREHKIKIIWNYLNKSMDDL